MAEPLESVTKPVMTARSASWARATGPVNTIKAHTNKTPRHDARLIFTPPADSSVEAVRRETSPKYMEPMPHRTFRWSPSPQQNFPTKIASPVFYLKQPSYSVPQPRLFPLYSRSTIDSP